ncbi:MAG: ABC transporter permease [Spirochaetales bacterium]
MHTRWRSLKTQLKREAWLHAFALTGIVFLLIFRYAPMVGVIIAFKDYDFLDGFLGFFTSPWVGLKHFREFVNDFRFSNILTNTLAISILKTVFAFPMPILFAIALNEIRSTRFKRTLQTVSYFPHFISWVVVSGLAFALFSTEFGAINNILLGLGLIERPLTILTDPDAFWTLAVVTDIWKSMGWWAIIFIAAIAGIDPNLYEAAEIDGAGRLARIRHVTLPGIRGAIVVVLVLSLGNLLGGGVSGSNFEQAYLLGNTLNNERSEIIQTFVVKVGLRDGRFDFAAAVGLMQAFISLILILTSNRVAKRVSGSALF